MYLDLERKTNITTTITISPVYFYGWDLSKVVCAHNLPLPNEYRETVSNREKKRNIVTLNLDN